MGKILTPDEFMRRQLPDIDLVAFTRVARSLERRVMNAYSIVGALRYGSALYRHYTMLSDVDCVILYQPQHRNHALRVIRGWVEYAQRYHVKASPLFVDVTVAQNALHSFTPLFWRHLQNAATDWEGYIKQNPLRWFAPPQLGGRQTLKETELNYFRFKLASLDKAYVRLPALDESSRFRFMQKALEAPMHAARKVLDLKRCYKKSTSPSRDSKSHTQQLYQRHMPGYMSGMLDKVTHAWAIYITKLYRGISQPRGGTLDIEEYRETLRELEAVIPTAIEFVRLNALYVVREL